MRSLCLSVLLTLYCVTLLSQSDRAVLIIIQSEDRKVIAAAHLTVDGESHHISDSKGEVLLTTNPELVRLEVSHISFAELDTTINATKFKEHILILKPNNYTIDPVTISDKQRLFEKENWSIKDIIHHDYGFVVSASEGSKRFVYLFDKNGVQVVKHRTKFKHESIKKGLKVGHYHLMNEAGGQEVLISTDTIIFLDKQPIEKYEKTLEKFLYSGANYSIVEEWKAHNKKYALSVVDHQTFEVAPFYNSFDEESFTRSQSVYREIIRLYFRDSYKLNPFAQPGDENAINVIADGTWTGDLTELIVSDTIQQVYNYYKSIYTKELAIATQVLDGRLYVLDFMKRTLFIYALGKYGLLEEIQKVPIPDDLVVGEFVNSGAEDELIITTGDSYCSYQISDSTFSWIDFEDGSYYYPKRTFYDDDMLYVLARRSRTKHKKSIFRHPVIR